MRHLARPQRTLFCLTGVLSLAVGGSSILAQSQSSTTSSGRTVNRAPVVTRSGSGASASGGHAINGTNVANRVNVGGATSSSSTGLGSPVANSGGRGWGSPVMSNGSQGWGSPVFNTARASTGGAAVNVGPGSYYNGGPAGGSGPVTSGGGNGGAAPGGNGGYVPSTPWRPSYGPYRPGYDNGYGYGYGYPDYGWGGYGPVFVMPNQSYLFNNVDQVNWSNGNGPLIVEERDRDQRDSAAAEAAPDTDKQQSIQDRAEQLQQRRKVTRLTPEKLHDLMIEGTRLFANGKYSDAAARFLRVTMADRLNVDATLAYAIARFATGDYQISALAIRRGIRRIPEVVDSDFDVRSRYGNIDDFANHLARLEHYLTEHPNDVDGWTVLGFVKHFSGQRSHAAEIFRTLQEMPKADQQVAQIFLEAKPAKAVQPGNPQTQPADNVAPADETNVEQAHFMLPPSHHASEKTVELISID